MKALVRKELQQSAIWLPVGLVIAAVACYLSLPKNQQFSPVAGTLIRILCFSA